MKMLIAVLMFVFAGVCCAECPRMDATGDCKVDLADFAIFASEWMLEGTRDPEPIEWVYVNDPGVDSHEDFCGLMSKYETTNAQYCQFLNAALASGDITVDADDKVYGAGGSNGGEDFVGQMYYDLAGAGFTYHGTANVGAARISFGGSLFTVDGGFDDHPVTYVSWYGATAFCNYYGYRLPTEWEWQAVADYDGNFTHGCGTSINTSIANYEESTHPDGTTVVGSFGSYGYGLSDMAGNVYEWTTSLRDPQSSSYILRGGGWHNDGNDCSVSDWSNGNPDSTNSGVGFRVCRGNEQLVPDVVGRTQLAAETAITDVHLTVGTIIEENSITVAAGYVISQNPAAGQLLMLGETVDLVVSLGPDPTVIYWVSISDPGVPDHEGFTGKMSKHETTNAQYCQFLNAAFASGDITVEADDKVYGAGGSNSGEDFVGQTYYDLAGPGLDYNGSTKVGPARISYTGSSFTVDSGFYDHPVSYVSWYGATAFCNYYGYRLPTEWEWQAVADYDGSFTHGCGVSINISIANYEETTHPDGTTVVGSFGSYGYGLSDMAGNIYEWTCSSRSPQSNSYILRGGGWPNDGNDCNVTDWSNGEPSSTNSGVGFRVCIAEPEPVAHLRMDETDVIAGSVIADSSGWDNDGIARDAMTSVNGVIGGALYFNGSSDSIDLGTPANLDFGTDEDASFAFWVKTGTTSVDRIYWKVGDSKLGFTIFTQADGTIRCLYGDGVSYAHDTNLVSTINDNAWHCVVIVIDTVNDEIRGYLEGVLDGTLDISNVTGDVSGGGTAYIGSKNGSTDFLKGSLDEFTIFDKALKQEEIRTYYNSAKRG